MNIATINDINEALTAIDSELINHVYLMDGELPTYSIAQLEYELPYLLDWVYSEENYVPSYHNCGLISRALAIVQENGYTLDPEFFNSIACNYDEAQYLCRKQYY